MARPSAGQVTEWAWKDGVTVSFGARLYAYGRRHRLVFGTNAQGWNRTRAEIELEDIQQRVDRGTWVPPEKRTTVKPASARRPDGHRHFGAFARGVIEAKRSHGLDADTLADLEWKLGYPVGYFGGFELLEIDVARVDAFRDELARRARVISAAAARGKPLLETVERGDGTSYKRRKRALSNNSSTRCSPSWARSSSAPSTTATSSATRSGWVSESSGSCRRSSQSARSSRSTSWPLFSRRRGSSMERPVETAASVGGERSPRSRSPASGSRSCATCAVSTSTWPASLRRTWAMLAAQAGRDPHWISDQIGHTSASFTLQVYQQTRNRRLSDPERRAVWELMRFADEPAKCPFTRQLTRRGEGFRPVNGPTADFRSDGLAVDALPDDEK